MSTLVCLDVVRGIPGGIRTIEPILHWTHADNFIAWFENHLPWKQMDFGPFYEFAPETMDEFIEDCQKALEKRGGSSKNIPSMLMIYTWQMLSCIGIPQKIPTNFKTENSNEWKTSGFSAVPANMIN